MNEATFNYLGFSVTFAGFYENKFVFHVGTKVVFVETIQELADMILVNKSPQPKAQDMAQSYEMMKKIMDNNPELGTNNTIL